jgi:hypothetical protein
MRPVARAKRAVRIVLIRPMRPVTLRSKKYAAMTVRNALFSESGGQEIGIRKEGIEK